MKVALINPPQIFSQYQVATGVTPPLGVAYLAAYCQRHGIPVQVIDALGEAPQTVTTFRDDIFLRGLPMSAIVERIDPDAALIGISNLFSFAYPAVRELARHLREAYPWVPIVLGGAHPSHMYQEAITQGAADYVVIGEGEIPLRQLCRHLEGAAALEQVPSLAYRESTGKVRITTPRNRLENLDAEEIPFPARELLPMENYIAAQESHGATNGRWTSMITSRGCPYGCTFCDIRRSRWVGRSPADVVDEIEQCFQRWGIREFHFEDDNMTLRRDRLIAICDEIIARKLPITWQTPNGIRASVTDRVMLEKMKASGCEHITVAPESGSERVVRDIIQKGEDFSHAQLLDVAREAHRLGMKVAAYFVLGMPGETAEDLEATIAYAKRLAKAGVDEAAFGLLIPLPGTPVWDQVVAKYGQPDYLDLLVIGDLNRAISWSEHLSADALHRARRQAYTSFHLCRAVYHPGAFLRTLVNVLRGFAETKTERTLRTYLRRASRPMARLAPARPGRYTPYQAERSLTVLLQHSADYAFSNSGLKALAVVFQDLTGWMRGRKLPHRPKGNG